MPWIGDEFLIKFAIPISPPDDLDLTPKFYVVTPVGSSGPMDAWTAQLIREQCVERELCKDSEIVITEKED